MPSKENSSSNFWNESADHMQFITDELPHALITYVFIVPNKQESLSEISIMTIQQSITSQLPCTTSMYN